MKVYSYGIEEIQELMDQVKELVLTDLFKENMISEEVLQEYSKTHTLILKKPSRISHFLKKIMHKDSVNEERLVILVAKIRKNDIESE